MKKKRERERELADMASGDGGLDSSSQAVCYSLMFLDMSL